MAEEATLSRSSLAASEHLYGEYLRGNRAAVFDALTEDVVWTSVCGPELPWGGSWRGRAGVEAYFGKLDETVRVTRFEIERRIVQGEWVVVLAHVSAVVLATGQDTRIYKADVMRIGPDGRVLEFREFYDSGTVLGHLTGPGAAPG